MTDPHATGPKTSGQLAFDLPLREAWSRADFFTTAANETALQVLDDWHDWAGGRLILQGPKGCGKTHLAHIWAAEAGAIWLTPGQITEHLGRISPDARVIVDDAHLVAGRAETPLFHLCNHLAAKGRLLLTAPLPPRDWGLTLPDLLSRLQAMQIARLHPPDDTLLAAVLVKLLADRQVAAPANLIPYLLPRMERSIDAARALVAALDARALASHRPLTRALAAEVLDTGTTE